MLLDVSTSTHAGENDNLLTRAASAILTAIRETDVAGWHRENRVLGVIFAELGAAGAKSILGVLRAKTNAILQSSLRVEELARLRITFHCFPEEWGGDETGVPIEKLYPDLVQREESKRVPRAIKRAIDILGSPSPS